jgi:hypothetical protein
MLPNKALQLTGISVALRAPSKPAAERQPFGRPQQRLFARQHERSGRLPVGVAKNA